MTKKEVKEIAKMQNKACGLLNEITTMGDYEKQVYTMQILFELSPQTAKADLTELINQFKRML